MTADFAWIRIRARRILRFLVLVGLLVPLTGVRSPQALAQELGVSTGDGAWIWQNPRPQGNDLRDVHFVDANTGWSVGRHGVIMHTVDGGASWMLQPAGVTTDLNGVAALDRSTAIAVGAGGVVLATRNAGQSWQRQPSGVTTNLWNVHFTGPSALYALGTAGTAIRSEDAGATWAIVGSPIRTGNFGQTQFLDRSRAFVMNVESDRSEIFRLDDAWGQTPTWTPMSTARPAMTSFRFLDDSTAIAVGSGGRISKSTDGGETWREVTVPTRANLQAITVGDRNTVHVVGDGGAVLKSVDAGDSWALLPEPRPSAAKLESIHFPDGQNGYVAGAQGTLLRTTDSGSTWVLLAQGSRGGLRSVHFFSPQAGVGVGERGAIVKTVDGGYNWRAIPSGTQRDLNGVRFINRQTGFAVGDGGTILRSDDTGESWRPVTSPVGVNLLAIGLAGDPETGELRVAVIAGDRNLALRSADGGSTWQQSTLPGGTDIASAVHFPEPRIGYIGGRTTIWQTTDFGRSWRVVAGGRAAPRDPYGFSFPSVNRGYAVGQNGQIVRTDDGGANWQTQTSGTRETLRAVFFLDEQRGITAGDAGVIRVTENGGGTWTAVDSGTHLNLWGIQFLDNALGVVVGEGGTVLLTTSGGLPTRDVPPAVVMVAPADSQSNVLPDTRVRITFSKDIAFAPVEYAEGGRFELRDQSGNIVPASASYERAERTVVIAPDRPMTAGTTYAVSVAGGPDGVVDTEGRRMVFGLSTRFRVGCELVPAGGFGRLISQESSVRERIGCPNADEYNIDAVEQVFERGHMVLIPETGQVIVTFFRDGRWSWFPDTYVQGENEPAVTAPSGLQAPRGRLGKVWREGEAVRDRLGFAVGPERAYQGAYQSFTGGHMIWTGSEQALIRTYLGDGGTVTMPDPAAPR